MFLRHTPLPKHRRIHVFSTEGDPKAHEELTCFQGHLYPQLEEGSGRRLSKEEGSQRLQVKNWKKALQVIDIYLKRYFQDQ